MKGEVGRAAWRYATGSLQRVEVCRHLPRIYTTLLTGWIKEMVRVSRLTYRRAPSIMTQK